MTIHIVTTCSVGSLKKFVKPYFKTKYPDEKLWYYEFQDEIPPVDEGVYLFHGGKVLDFLKQEGLVAKNRTLNSLRGSVFAVNGTKGMVGFSPDIINVDPAKRMDVMWDNELVGRLATTGHIKPLLGHYRWVKSFKDCIKYLKGQIKLGHNPPLSVDLETVGLNPYDPEKHIVSMFVTYKHEQADGIKFTKEYQPTGELLEQIRWLLTNPRIRVRGANLKYDMGWWREKWGIVCTNQTMDTTIVGSLLDENRSNSLNTHAKVYTTMGGYDDELNEKHDKSRMDLIPDDDLLPYAGGDTDATHRVSEVMIKDLLSDETLTRFYVELLQPVSLMLADMEAEGVCIDVDEFHRLGAELAEASDYAHEQAIAMLPNKIKLKYKDDLKLTRKAILSDYMFTNMGLNLEPLLLTPKAKTPSTAMDHLVEFADHPKAGPFIKKLEEYNSINKTLGTYVKGFLNHLREDGRLHPTAVLYKGDYGDGDSGTVTGRLAFKDPAMQCMVGDTLVVTDKGEVHLKEIVENPSQYRVLTHTGSWRQVVGSYHNGVKAIYRIRLDSGREINCTGNHPILTLDGFVRADRLTSTHVILNQSTQERSHYAEVFGFIRKAVWSVGSAIKGGVCKSRDLGMSMRLWKYTAGTVRKPNIWEHSYLRMLMGGGQDYPRTQTEGGKSNVPYMVFNEVSMPESQSRCLQELWWAGHYSMQAVATVRELLRGYGRKAARIFYREARQRSWIQPRELYLAGTTVAEPKHKEVQQALSAGFICDSIKSIETVGQRETFDLTIDRCHSFVADGVVVHNTLPKHTVWAKPLRKGYVAPEGYSIVQWDYSQGELRITACVANEKHMIEAYSAGIDLHLVTGAKVSGYEFEDVVGMKLEGTEEQKKLVAKIRQNGKAGNFGLIYGMQAKGYQVYAKTSYGVEIDLKTAEHHRNTFFDLYPRLLPWHDETIDYATEHGYVRSPLGRVRHLPNLYSKEYKLKSKAERQAINSPVQSALSDMAQLAMVEFRKQHPEYDTTVRFCMTTHDSVVAYVRDDLINEVSVYMKHTMETLPLKKFGWNPPLTFIADIEVGKRLSDLKEYTPTELELPF